VQNVLHSSIEEARTAAVTIFIVGQTFYLFNCRSMHLSMFKLGVFANGWLIVGVVLMLLSQLLFIYTPFMNALFSTAPIGVDEWLIVVASSLIIYVAVELEKRFRYKKFLATKQ
jgi:cation-transporting P-type ATPase F